MNKYTTTYCESSITENGTRVPYKLFCNGKAIDRCRTKEQAARAVQRHVRKQAEDKLLDIELKKLESAGYGL